MGPRPHLRGFDGFMDPPLSAWPAVGLWSLLLLLPLLVWFGPAAWRRLQRERRLRQPFPAAWRRLLHRHMPLYTRLPPALQARLRREVQALVRQPFIGCAGLDVTDEMRVLIAAQAALLLLGGDKGGFANLREVLVYPGAFVVDRPVADEAGLQRDERRVHSGESWQRGQVILSWDDVQRGAADPADGDNVVIHEFAHQLDQQRGVASGAPFLGHPGRYPAWAAAFSAAFADVRQREAHGERTLIGAYGASAPAEFFAVASERFFERPEALHAEHPAMYAELARYYGVDPRSW
jgi:Mlc titration factor MtfA (ptsG expression regulator)